MLALEMETEIREGTAIIKSQRKAEAKKQTNGSEKIVCELFRARFLV